MVVYLDKKEKMRLYRARIDGGHSSIGRAPDCGSGGCGFKSRCPPIRKVYACRQYALVAQLDRAPDFESVGRRFESCRAYKKHEF